MRWTPQMDSCLFDSMLEQRTCGNFIDGQFSTHGYHEVLTTLRALFGPNIKKDHVKNHLKTLKDHFGKCYDLFNSWSGIGWDPVAEMFEAEPHVWQEICEAKPKAMRWMRTKVHNYGKMCELYATDRATSRGAYNAADIMTQWEMDRFDLDDSVEGITCIKRV